MVKFLRFAAMGVSQNSIAFSCGCAQSTASDVLRAARAHQLPRPLPEEMDDAAIRAVIYPKESRKSRGKAAIGHESVASELMRRGMTMSLLWDECCDAAIARGEEPCMHSAFCRERRDWAQRRDVRMRIERRAAEAIRVGWVGDAGEAIGPDTGEILKAYVLAACLPCSDCLHAEGFCKTDEEAWIAARAHMFSFFGGSTPILAPDSDNQERRGDARRQRAAPPHERALRVRRRADAREEAARQGERRDGRRGHRAAGHDGFAQEAAHVVPRLQQSADRAGDGDKLPPLPEARGQQGEHLPRPGGTDAHPAAGQALRDVRPQGGRRRFQLPRRLRGSLVLGAVPARRARGHRGGHAQERVRHARREARRHPRAGAAQGRLQDRPEPHARRAPRLRRAERGPLPQRGCGRSCRGVLGLAKAHGKGLLEEACAKALPRTPRLSHKVAKDILAAPEKEREEAGDGDGAYLRGGEHYESFDNDDEPGEDEEQRRTNRPWARCTR